MAARGVPQIGEEFAGYRIERLIGRGGMGVVYLAEHMRLEQKRALKLLPPEMADDEGFRQRFERESRMAASLEHPNIVPIHDAGEVEGLLFISMRYIEGHDLKKLIEREGALHPDRSVSLLEQVASALDEAHGAGLVHRDVKPQNTLVTPPKGSRSVERAYLTDFGLTKQYGSKTGVTAAGTMLGTVDYMAPEQLEAKDVDARADVYALACVLYECLSGSVPFDRPTMASVMMAHMSEAPPRVTELNAELPVGLNDIIAKGMSKSRDDRYATCGELIDAAREVIAGRADGTGTQVAGAGFPGTVVAPGAREDLSPGRPSGDHPAGGEPPWPAQDVVDPGQQGWAAAAGQGGPSDPNQQAWDQQQGWPGQGSDPSQAAWGGQPSGPQAWPQEQQQQQSWPQEQQQQSWPQQPSGGYQQPGWTAPQKRKGGLPPWGIGAIVGGVALLLILIVVIAISGGDDPGPAPNPDPDPVPAEVTTSFAARSVTTFPDDVAELLPAELDGVPDAELDPGVV
ncbi:MAG: serine/threonine-protein kinase, partial [Candidatus Limnocylindria bacterium]